MTTCAVTRKTFYCDLPIPDACCSLSDIAVYLSSKIWVCGGMSIHLWVPTLQNCQWNGYWVWCISHFFPAQHTFRRKLLQILTSEFLLLCGNEFQVGPQHMLSSEGQVALCDSTGVRCWLGLNDDKRQAHREKSGQTQRKLNLSWAGNLGVVLGEGQQDTGVIWWANLRLNIDGGCRYCLCCDGSALIFLLMRGCRIYRNTNTVGVDCPVCSTTKSGTGVRPMPGNETTS